MVDLAWISIWSVLCFGIGLPLVRLLGEEMFHHRVWTAPVIGYSTLAMVSTIGYASGLSLRSMFAGSLILATAGWIWWFVGRRWSEFSGSEAVFGFWVLALVIFLVPKWTGSYQFFVFQGNPWDVFGYLESAVIYAHDSYAAIKSGRLAHDPLYQTASGNLFVRPSVHILYGVFAQFDLRMMHRLHYTFQVFLISQCIPVLVFLIVNLFGTSIGLSSLLAFAFTVGFWGQYIVDINAWSQISSMAIQLLCVAVTGITFRHSGISAGPALGVKLAVILGTLFASMGYLYPEGFMFHLPAVTGMILILAALSEHRARKAAVLTGTVGVFALWVYPCYAFTLSNGLRQARWAHTTPVEWWTFFQAYIFGREGRGSGWFGGIVDALAGIEGLYFLTPMPHSDRWSKLAVRIGLMCLFMGLIAASGRAFARSIKDRSIRPVSIAFLWVVGVEVASIAYVASQRLFWAAGKGLSYMSPYWMLFLMAPMIFKRRLNLGKMFVGPSAVLIAAQIGFGLGRPVAGLHEDGIHFSAPYPSVNSAASKRDFRWSIDEVVRGVSDCREVAISIPDEWLRRYLVVGFKSLGRAVVSGEKSECVVGIDVGKAGGPARLVVKHTLR